MTTIYQRLFSMIWWIAAFLQLAGCGGAAADTEPAVVQLQVATISAPSAMPTATIASLASPATTASGTGAFVVAVAPAASTAESAALESADVMAELRAASPFASQGENWAVECNGHVGAIGKVGEQGIAGAWQPDTYGSLRFGKVVDPLDSSRTALVFRANAHDAQVWGAPRCEITASPSRGGKLVPGQDFWMAFALHLPAWAVGPEEQILMQWHAGDGNIPLNPMLALSVKAGTLRLVARHNSASVASKSTTTTQLLWESRDLPIRHWSTLVFQGRIAPQQGQGGLVRMWVDGTLVADHAGPLGYNLPGGSMYAKLGHYQWQDASNVWSNPAATKTVLVRNPLLVRDVTGRYAEPTLRARVQAR